MRVPSGHKAASALTRLEYPADFKLSESGRNDAYRLTSMPPRCDLLLNVRDQSPLGAGVALDVALRRLDRPMPGEQLHVA